MKVAPSILSVLNEDLKQIIKKLEDANVKYLHLDVMDNKFVPNYTFDAKFVKQIREITSITLDTHLMIEKPETTIDTYIEANSDYICFHYEATTKHKEIIDKIKKSGLKVGISVKPNTDIDVLMPLLKDLDLVLVMSVEPGFGGQKFMNKMLSKVRTLKKLKEDNNYQYLIEIDGGINNETSLLAKEAGCDIIVVGTYLFKQSDLSKTIKELEKQ